MDTVICKELIVSTIKRRGKGVTGSPIRIITEVYEKDGTLVAEHDPFEKEFTADETLEFCQWYLNNQFDKDHIIDPGKIHAWKYLTERR